MVNSKRQFHIIENTKKNELADKYINTKFKSKKKQCKNRSRKRNKTKRKQMLKEKKHNNL